MVEKVIATKTALALIEELKRKHGPVIFHQSGGCCDNSAANCYLPGELTIGAGDEYLGDIGGSPFYISKSQYEYWKHTQLIIDVIDVRPRGYVFPGRAGGQGLSYPLARVHARRVAGAGQGKSLTYCWH
jgi:uncharacterized protein